MLLLLILERNILWWITHEMKKILISIFGLLLYFSISTYAQDIPKQVIFSAPSTIGPANLYAIQNIAPSGFILKDGITINTRINVANTGASTLSIMGGPAIPIQKQITTGLAALGAGDLQANNQVYSFTYNSITNTFVITTTLATGVSYGSTTHAISPAEWSAGQTLMVTTANQVFTLPASTSLSSNGGIILGVVGALNVSIALAAGTDTINGGTAGSPATVNSKLTVITTDGAGHFSIP